MKNSQESLWINGGFPSLAESRPSHGLCVQTQMWKEKRFPRDSSCSWVSDVLALGNRERDDVILLWSPVQRSLL